MRKILLLLSLLMSVMTFAQNNGITYQAVIYSTNGESVPGVKNTSAPLANQSICLQFNIIDDTSQTEYQEKTTVTTDEFGMVNLIIGNGTQTGGYASSFDGIVWANSKKSLKVSLDQSGSCSNFSEISNQLLTYVPFALAANSATNVSGVVSIAHGGTNATTVAGVKTNLQLQNVDNTSDSNKPLSIASQNALALKVDKVTGKGLSTEDFTTTEKTKLASLSNSDLSNYATLTNLATKVDKVTGKGLSTEDYTTTEKTKLAGITGTNTGDQDLSGYATLTNLATKVDKVNGKALSTEDFTTAEKTKLAGITGTNTGDQDLSSYATLTNLATKVDKVIGKGLSTEDYSTTEKTKLAAISGTNTGDQDLSSYATLTNLTTKVDKVTGKELSSNDYTTAEKTKLAAISGVNTGDQDLSLYATTTSVALKANTADVTSDLATKVDKVTGKELSSNDYTTAEKTKLAAISGINTGDQDLSGYATLTNLATKVDKVIGKGLSTEDYSTTEKTKLAAISGTNTGDQDLSSYATLTNLTTKVDKVAGKGLSTEDYTTTEKTKLAGITGTNTGDQDLSGYATLTNLTTKVDKVTGKGLSTEDFTSAEKTKLANATDINTVGTIVARDASGNFSAGTINATLFGNASTATKATNIDGGSGGQVLYQTGVGTTSFLPANTLNTRKFLSSVGANGSATVPSWQAITPSDIVSSSSQTSGYLNFETGVFSAQSWTELNTQWSIISGWANTRNYNGLAYQGSYAIIAPDSQDFTLQASNDFNLSSIYIKSDFQITATSIEFKGYDAAGILVGTVSVNVTSLNQFSFSNVSIGLNGIRKLVFHPVGYNVNSMGGGNFALDYFNIDVITKNNLNTVNGLLKSNGSGSITAAVSGTDYLSPTALTSLVPYTGATGSVNLGSYDLTVNSVKVGLGAGAKPSNTSVGANALISNTTGVYNTAFGKDALQNNAAGGLNTAIGNAALQANTGSFNTGLGKEALSSNTSGSFNTAIGTEALRGNTTGNKITTLGYQAEVASGNLTNATAIGSGAVVSTSNTIQLGDTGVTNVNTYGSITANAAISNEITADFTIDVTNVEQYKGKVIICNPSNPITITFATGLPIGFNCMILQKSADANKINLTGGSGVTIKNRNNYTATAGNYAIATVVSIGGDILVTAGDMQ